MHLIFFSSAGWEDWDVEHGPLTRHAMPVLIDDDLCFEDEFGPRATVAANRWLGELPVSGAPSANTWEVYGRVLKDWLAFLGVHGLSAFGARERLRAGLSLYAEYRLAGPLEIRLAESSWNLHVGTLAQFYEWAEDEGYASAVPFSYAAAKRLVEDRLVTVRRNLAKVRQPRAHTTIKYLAPEFAGLFVHVLEGLLPDGSPDPRFRGLNPGRNAAMARLVLSSGLRRQEFTHLLVPEVPPLPSEPTALPILLPVAAGITKGRKQRTTWISYDALDLVHRYLDLERPLAADGSTWRPDPAVGDPLVVTTADWHGGKVNDRRVSWSRLTPADRLRLVDADGRSLLLALQRDGAPFLDWATVFRRVSDDIRDRFEPRFPHVHPHRLRHSMAMATLEQLVAGYYQQAAQLVVDTDDNPALALYLTRADPMEVLRDLLGHSSVTSTQVYLSRLDTTRVFRDAYEQAGRAAGLSEDVLAEVDAEFAEDDDWTVQV
jgi:site-specific recombinase XerD